VQTRISGEVEVLLEGDFLGKLLRREMKVVVGLMILMGLFAVGGQA
jgi:hypothetical protein